MNTTPDRAGLKDSLTPDLSVSNSAAIGTFRLVASASTIVSVGLARPVSIRLMYVRKRPQRWAEVLLRQAGRQPELTDSHPKLELNTRSHDRTVLSVHSFVHTH